jgi:hypothetical protein
VDKLRDLTPKGDVKGGGATTGDMEEQARGREAEWIWRGKVDEKLTKLDKIADDVDKLKTKVTQLVLLSGIIAFFFSSAMSIIVGVAIRIITK